MVKITVKWGKEKYDDVEIDTSQDIDALRTILFSLTNVPGPKQKILYKGSVLKDTTNLAGLNIPDGAVFMLMGSAEERKIEEPSKKTVFIEDLTPEEKAKIFKEKTGEILPCGLKNMGNTCYMNASLQCLRRVNELKEALLKFRATNPQSFEEQFPANLGKVFKDLDNKGDAVLPYEFFQLLINFVPHFGETAGQSYKQQDADECFMAILDNIYPYLKHTNEEGDKSDLIDYLFKIDFETTFTCLENPDEPAEKRTEFNRKLPCIIDNQSKPVDHLSEGILAGLEEIIDKNSPSLGRMASYKKVNKLKKLPPYLVIQNIRFLWKKAVENTGSKATKAKILRCVTFPKVLDMYSFCTDELKKNLDYGRDYEKKKNEEKAQADINKFETYKRDLEKSGKLIPEDTRELFKKFKAEQVDSEIKEHDDRLYRKIGTGLETGNYELIAVLTHQGRTSDSGHYVGWVHHKGDEWYKYDDDTVTVVKIDEVLALKGGGDWHMGYYCIYRKIELA